MTADTQPAPVAEEDRLRADLYNYLGVMLAGPPDEVLLAQTMGLEGDGSDLGKAISGLARVAKVCKPKKTETEFKIFLPETSRKVELVTRF